MNEYEWLEEDSDEFKNYYYAKMLGEGQGYTEKKASFPRPSGTDINTIGTTYTPVVEERFKIHKIPQVHGVYLVHHEPKATEELVWIESASTATEEKIKPVKEKPDEQPSLEFTIVSISSHGQKKRLLKPVVMRISKRGDKFLYDSKELNLSGKRDTYRDAINEFASILFTKSDEGIKNKSKSIGLWNLLEELTGTIKGPRDWSVEHDHYIYGTPKRDEKKNE
ncbi:MAG: hypothetical protein HYW01_00750 [Deltaproteobacteria bacterium]|nr:hypothetical protein [Deltaproteobacteria bacterium]